MVLLEQAAFLTELSRLYNANREQGQVTFSLKRVTTDGEPCCLVRARSDKKKISTEVSAKEYARFQGELSNIVLVQTDGLQKRDKTKNRGDKRRNHSA
mmetsp:Transcript_21587/g.49746  ORF Transcript_21587/g.49746 Transcript_21587/m.49746 type:complete len:98 (+) Transcript_21587:183-476(+)|eukprot:CAMPEP_0182574042 /NCGR_PEP_ID=MMETSP1324-20130603/21747_1 /TAXON_ID=236786 /ORGANISM="Florenciella sp., Strain RCC1587" /LENGTH=97 /DNA_ID=CAMNT_0024789275 /DNA_START=157 /DNA_END=450 /DNA_ORIENTATION=+